MRKITGHETNPVNEAISITADERDAENGNTSHVYGVTWLDPDGDRVGVEVLFQNGPIKEHGVNGVTNEVLLAILIDRFQGFQTSKWACEENERTLYHLVEALGAQIERTKGREKRGVEGTHEV
jgi:hypothetical protein